MQLPERLVRRLGQRRQDAIFRAVRGRVRLSSDVSEIKLVFSIPPHRPTPNIAASWNVAPTDPLPVVRYDAKAGERSLDVMRWGLVPFWAKDLKVGFSNINAKAEGIEGRPEFREAFQRRRCLVPVDDFYDWKKTATGKQPYAITLTDRGLLALAGLWENWHSPASGYAASRSSRRHQTSFAPNSTIECPWS
jgi:putative SOS response-associated peptidase YedK